MHPLKGKKMQAVSFRDLDELFEFLPPDELELLRHMRQLILQSLPLAEEHLAYNVPFYRKRRNIAYLWPGSVPWGKTTFKGVQFGLSNGHLLDDPTGFMEAGNRKFVRIRVFRSMEDWNEEAQDMMRYLLFQAWEVDEQRP